MSKVSTGWGFIPQQGPVRFLFENDLFLIVGTLTGFIWANVHPDSYQQIPHRLDFIVNEVAMMFFFALAGKEIREAMLPGGTLSSLRTAALPLLGTLGGMIGPALIFFLGAQALNPALTRGWAIPMATDIAFAYLAARLIFGRAHPAIVFLLLLAIADDAGGLVVLALFYPSEELHLGLFALLFGAAIALGVLFRRVFGWRSFWPYLIGSGPLLWFGFSLGGFHPALALVPLMWLLPHQHDQPPPKSQVSHPEHDALSRFGHWWEKPVGVILGFFGFINAGVEVSTIGAGTGLVLAGLLFGKPLGIVLMTKLGQLFGLSLPKGMGTRDLVVVSFAAATGFTVALFISIVAFPPGPLQDSVKMGSLLSFGAIPLTFLIARLFPARPR